jgi:aspartyl-tRNA(Asn)/glutamyl-tRNA(Gln) amidotransferase subunit C
MNIKDVENLAELSRIDLSEEEKGKILGDMEGILAYIKSIESVDVKDVKVEHDIYNVWREDEPQMREFSKDIILEQFPDSQDDFLKVKKIL